MIWRNTRFSSISSRSPTTPKSRSRARRTSRRRASSGALPLAIAMPPRCLAARTSLQGRSKPPSLRPDRHSLTPTAYAAGTASRARRWALMQSLLSMLDSSPAVAYAFGVPAIMLGSILLVAAIIALLGAGDGHHDDTARGH